MPRRRPLRQALNNHSGAEAHFQNVIVRSDVKEVGNPGAATRIGARHDLAAQPPQDAGLTGADLVERTDQQLGVCWTGPFVT